MARPFSFADSCSAWSPYFVVQTVVPYNTQSDWRGRVKVKSLSVIPFDLLMNQATLGMYL
jgi:hypothetical protein